MSDGYEDVRKELRKLLANGATLEELQLQLKSELNEGNIKKRDSALIARLLREEFEGKKSVKPIPRIEVKPEAADWRPAGRPACFVCSGTGNMVGRRCSKCRGMGYL